MPSINLIKSSDGTGDAAIATVTTVRSALATTILVDTVDNIPATFMASMGTPHTFVDPITSETITVISEATARDFIGQVVGTHLEIVSMAPGYVDDIGSAVGDVVIIKPTTEWANNIAEVLAVSHADDGTLKVANNGAIFDANGNEQIKFVTTASAVNELNVKNGATGTGPTIGATGGDTNIDINVAPKGTGKLKGVVDNLYNPYKFYVYRSAAYTISGTTVIPFDTKVFDTGSNVDVVTNKGRFTAPVAGFYFFSAQLYWSGINMNGVGYSVSLVKNGAQVLSGLFSVPSNTSPVNYGATVSGILSLAANDYVEVADIYGSNKALGTGSSTVNYFQGFLVSRT